MKQPVPGVYEDTPAPSPSQHLMAWEVLKDGEWFATDEGSAAYWKSVGKDVRLRSGASEPTAWEALTGTAGKSEGCDRPFWLREDAVAYVQRHGGYIRPLFSSPVGPDARTIARAISESYGENPDDLAPLSRICGPNNEPLPCWKAYEEQAEAVLALFSTPSPSPREVGTSNKREIK